MNAFGQDATILGLDRENFGEPSFKLPGIKQDKRFKIRIFRDDEVTELWYENVTHIFWTNGGTILTICLPDQKKHAHWPREQISHYDIFEQ